MKNIIWLMLIALLPFSNANAQRSKEKRQIEERVREIQNDKSYLTALGSGETSEEADKAALSLLSSQISVCVSSEINVHTNVSENGQSFNKNEQVNSQIQTYSINNLPNVKRIEYGEEPEIYVLRYMKTDEVNAIFKNRADKILNFVEMGNAQEKRLQIADALRYYSWALTLLQSYPYESQLKVPSENGPMPAKPWLDAKINEILHDLKFEVTDAEKHENKEFAYTLLLNISYKGHPVTNLDYYYHNGYSYIGPLSAKDGRGVADFTDYPSDGFKVRIEYIFRTQAENLDSELRSVLLHIKPQTFPSATQNIAISESQKKLHKRALKEEDMEQPILATSGNVVMEVNDQERIELERVVEENSAQEDREMVLKDIMGKVEKAIQDKEYAPVKEYFTENGYQMFEKLIAYGNASLAGTPKFNILETERCILCKSLPLVFRFSGNREFMEDVTFRFTPDNRIESLAFTLNRIAENDILKMNSWEESSRIALISFLEDYQTAYALKRLDYIECIFSEDAWIITGTVLKKANLDPEDRISFDHSDVKYTTYTKQEYIDKLRISFADKEFINLRFENNDIRKDARGLEIYAIQIKQDYYSNNYGDSGYLTLLVDLRNELPIIHIRVWQELKDEDFTAARFLGTLK